MKRTDTIPETIYERKKKLRLCLKCNSPLHPEETKKHCEKCRKIITQNYQFKKEYCKEQNICFLCLKPLSNTEYFKCHKCYEKARITQIPYNDKLDRKSKAPKLCKGGCGALVDVFGKYCPTCKIESRKRNAKNSSDKAKQKKLQNRQTIIKKTKPKPKTKTPQETTLTEKEKQISVKDFYLQLEINELKNTGNYFGFNFRMLRLFKKLSVLNFANIINLKTVELQKIESGKKKLDLFEFKQIMIKLEIAPSIFKIKHDKLYKKLFLKFNTEVINGELLKLKENEKQYEN